MFSHFVRKLSSILASGPARTVRLGGRKWVLSSDAPTLFGPHGPDLERWIETGAASIVKTGPHRTVYRVELPKGVVYVKHCRIMGPRAWMREMLRPAKARLEFENLQALHARGISAATPLAWGTGETRWPGESWLITQSLEGASPFTSIVETPLAPGKRQELARTLGRFFARLHESGVAHPDPHPGNLLMDGCQVSLIDLHAVSLSSPLSWQSRKANLVLFNRWFQLRATRTDRLRFWHAYRAASSISIPADGAKQVESATAESNRRFWSGRVRRCLGTNRYFQKLSNGCMRGHAVRDLPESVLRPFLYDPDSLFLSATVLKDSRTSKVGIVTLDGRVYLLKRVNIRSRIEPWKNLLRPSAVLRSWISGHALRDRWLPTPRPLAMLHRWDHGRPAEGFLLTEVVEQPTDLNPSVSDRLARMLRQMHDRGVSHRDLKAANILLEHGSVPMLIDLVGVRLGESVSFHQRAKELARINASFLTGISRSERLRFLKSYLSAGEVLLTDWKKWWRAIEAATARKLAKNRRSGRPLA